MFYAETAGTAQGVDVALPYGGVGGHGACANPIFYAETAGTAQGVDVALPYGGGWGGAWSVCKPNVLCRNRWNSARS